MAEQIGYGSVFSFLVGSTFTPLTNVLDFAYGSDKVDTIDNTDMSTASETRTFVSGLRNPGDITVKFNVTPGDATQQAFAALEGAGIQSFKTAMAGSVQVKTFSGIIESLDTTYPLDKLPVTTAKIKISGPVTIVTY